MKQQQLKRNICIGLTDGITIPLSVAAGLSQLVDSSATIVIACIAVALAGSVTMSIGGFIEARNYEPSRFNIHGALLIGLSYLCGGLSVAVPFLFFSRPQDALTCTLIVSSLVLLLAGYADSTMHGAAGWTGALRVWITGMLAALADYLVAGLF